MGVCDWKNKKSASKDLTGAGDRVFCAMILTKEQIEVLNNFCATPSTTNLTKTYIHVIDALDASGVSNPGKLSWSTARSVAGIVLKLVEAERKLLKSREQVDLQQEIRVYY